MLITNKSSDAAHCYAVTGGVSVSRRQRADLKRNQFSGEKYNTGAVVSLRDPSMKVKRIAGKGGERKTRQEELMLWEV